MKKLITLILAALLILSLAACGKKTDPTGSSGGNGNTPGGNGAASQDAQTGAPGNTNDPQGGPVESAMVPGTLNFVNLKEGETPALKALRLYGNRAGAVDEGNGKGFNYKPASTEDIRCIFELLEWVEIYPDTEKTNGFRLWVFEHREDQTSYEKLTFSDVIDGYATSLDLEKPESEDDPWGSFYLPEDFPEGYYDFIFTVDGKTAATLLTRFYKAGELENKSDAELEQIQKGLSPLQVK